MDCALDGQASPEALRTRGGRVARVDIVGAARQDRVELLTLLEALEPREWEHPSLCAGWRIRDVVAHLLSFDDLSPTQSARLLVQGRMTFSRVNDRALERFSTATPAQLVDRLRRNPLPRGLTTGFGSRIGLVDGLIHQQDIRRPLGRPRQIPTAVLRVALNFATWAPPLHGLWTARGVRLVATDVDWSAGRGPKAAGQGEAVLLAMVGREGVAAELTGRGAEILTTRSPSSGR